MTNDRARCGLNPSPTAFSLFLSPIFDNRVRIRYESGRFAYVCGPIGPRSHESRKIRKIRVLFCTWLAALHSLTLLNILYTS